MKSADLQTLGSYRLLEELGAGAMGTVFRAEDEGREVALKVIHPHLLGREGFFRRFQREVRAGRKVDHPNVVRTLGCDLLFVDDEPRSFLVMEYVQGRTLRDLLHDLGCVPETLVREIGRQVAEGLGAIHAAGLVHRDLKPENVLITDDHRIRIMDLGVARHTELSTALTREGQFAGSLLYAAPEQFRGGSDVGPAADLYALGVVLYELVTGVNPFRHDEPGAVVHAHLDLVPERLDRRTEEISPFLAEIVATLLAKEPDERLESATSLARVLADGEGSRWWHDRDRALRVEREPRVRIPVRRETKVYGRETELALCQAAWQRARGGDGNALLLEGEAGIGKTRLMDAFLDGLARDEAQILYGSYPPLGGTAAILDALLERFGHAELEDSLESYFQVTPRLVPALAAAIRCEVAPAGTPPLPDDGLHGVLVQLMRAMAKERPLVWVVEDLHFADGESRQLLLSLARAVAGHPILLLFTTRPELSERELIEFSRVEHLRRAALGRLGAREVILLLQDAFASRALAEKLGGKIALKSDGVPFFVFEMIQGLKEGQFISQLPDGTWIESKAIEEIVVPSAVRDLIAIRLQGLSREERAVLEVGAVVGYEFDPDLVARVLGRSRVAVLQDAADIERRTGVLRAAGRRARFDHHQIQEVLYEDLIPALREEYHSLLAIAFADREGASVGHESDVSGEAGVFLAFHGLKGRQPKDGLPYLTHALRGLEETHASEGALRLCEAALTVPGLLEGKARLRILMQKDSRLAFLGLHGERESVLEEARALAEASGDKESTAGAEGATGVLLTRTGRHVEAMEHCERALALHRELGDEDGEAATLINVGSVRRKLGRYAEAQAQFERGRELAKACGSRKREGVAAANLGLLFAELGRFEEAIAHHERARAIARETRQPKSEALATYNLASTLLRLGRVEEAKGYYERSLAVSQEIGSRRGEAQVAGSLGSLARRQGWFEEALEHQERALALSRELGGPAVEAWLEVGIGSLLLRLGRPEEARRRTERGLDIARRSRERLWEAAALGALGDIHASSGAGEPAERCFREALRLRRELGVRPGVVETLVSLGALLLDYDRPEEAAPLLHEARQLAREIGVTPVEVRVLCLEALHYGGSVGEASEALAGQHASLRSEDRLEDHFLLWRATQDSRHLTEAKRLLDHLVEHAPEEYRESMLENVPLHRDIVKAWAAHGGST